MAKIIGYIRVSTELQDTEKQRHLLLEYAQQNRIVIDDFIEVEISSRKSQKERRIDELQKVLQPDDTLIAAELSRLGRNMLEVMNLINTLQENRITVILIRQPELSTNAPHVKLLTAIYGYIDETEREFISMRTRQGLAAAKAKGKLLGRPKGSRNKNNKLMPFRDAILTYLNMGLDVATVRKIINSESELGLTYQSYRYFILQDSELTAAWKQKHLVS